MPWFFVKSGRGQQGDAIASVYNVVARSNEWPEADLPARPSVDALVRLAVTSQASRLRDEILHSRAPMVVTLGEEARRVLGEIADETTGNATPLTVVGYGRRCSATIGDRDIAWVALKHPGQRSHAWRDAHASWKP